MLNLPLSLRQEKNKLSGGGAWIILLAVTLPDASVLRLARNTDDVSFGGHTYPARPFEVGESRQDGDGRVQGFQVRIANPDRALSPYLRLYDGLIGCAVEVVVVSSANLAADHSELTAYFDVIACDNDSDAGITTFTLGATNPMRRPFPPFSAMPRACPWRFKGAECGYAGAATSCGRNLDACRALGNSARFGGRPGLAVGAIRFV